LGNSYILRPGVPGKCKNSIYPDRRGIKVGGIWTWLKIGPFFLLS
jgi:hypothetical protein